LNHPWKTLYQDWGHQLHLLLFYKSIHCQTENISDLHRSQVLSWELLFVLPIRMFHALSLLLFLISLLLQPLQFHLPLLFLQRFPLLLCLILLQMSHLLFLRHLPFLQWVLLCSYIDLQLLLQKRCIYRLG